MSSNSDRIMDDECRRNLRNLVKNYKHQLEIDASNTMQSCLQKDKIENDVSIGRLRNKEEYGKEVRLHIFARSFNRESDITVIDGENFQDYVSQNKIDFTDLNTMGYEGNTSQESNTESSDIHIRPRNGGSFYRELIRSEGVRNLSLYICEESDEKKGFAKREALIY